MVVRAGDFSLVLWRSTRRATSLLACRSMARPPLIRAASSSAGGWGWAAGVDALGLRERDPPYSGHTLVLDLIIWSGGLGELWMRICSASRRPTSRISTW